jgi:hypothetical protein
MCVLQPNGTVKFLLKYYIKYYYELMGNVVAQLVEALRYKPEGREFDYRWCKCFTLFRRNIESTQPLTQINIRNIF